MPKRRAIGDTLTGGTRDVNPQYLHGILTLSAANTTTSITLGTPIVRVGTGSTTASQSIIMEVLKIFVDLPNSDKDPGATGTPQSATLVFMTTDPSTTAATFENPRLFAMARRQSRSSFTAAGTGAQNQEVEPIEIDLTDGAGHGILIATDNIFVQGQSVDMTAAGVFRWKILYRFKEVSLVEYIGIVQSQQ